MFFKYICVIVLWTKEASRSPHRYCIVTPPSLFASLSGERITCMTKSTSAPSSSLPLRVFFDGAVRNSGTFTYTKNPTITSIAPMTSFSAGGLILTITGTHFTSIKSPKMFIRDGNLTSKPTVSFSLNDCLIFYSNQRCFFFIFYLHFILNCIHHNKCCSMSQIWH